MQWLSSGIRNYRIQNMGRIKLGNNHREVCPFQKTHRPSVAANSVTGVCRAPPLVRLGLSRRCRPSWTFEPVRGGSADGRRPCFKQSTATLFGSRFNATVRQRAIAPRQAPAASRRWTALSKSRLGPASEYRSKACKTNWSICIMTDSSEVTVVRSSDWLGLFAR